MASGTDANHQALARIAGIDDGSGARAIRLPPLEDRVIDRMAERLTTQPRVAFFCPEEGLEGNFGLLSEELDRLGCETHWIYGTIGAYQRSVRGRKWLIINDMGRRLRGFDAFVTTTVMDCLPSSTLRVLHDHISFAPFDLESLLNRLMVQERAPARRLETIRDLFNDHSAYVSFAPFYDLILTSSRPIQDITIDALRFMGYRETVDPGPAPSCTLDLSAIAHLIDTAQYRRSINVVQSGYCKLDEPIRRFAGVPEEKVIVFAPTPTDDKGNKENDIWGNAIAVKKFGAEILRRVCVAYPDYRVVFKPYKDEKPEVIEVARAFVDQCPNLEIDECGSNYWDLYSRTALIISDFSSTAYTFALGIGRPVVFFSANEATLPDVIRLNTYCKNRERVGLVASSVDGVVEGIGTILSNYSQFLDRVATFRQENLVEPGRASSVAARAIVARLTKREVPGTVMTRPS